MAADTICRIASTTRPVVAVCAMKVGQVPGIWASIKIAQVSATQSAWDGEVPLTAVARVTCPPAGLGPGPPWIWA